MSRINVYFKTVEAFVYANDSRCERLFRPQDRCGCLSALSADDNYRRR